MKLRITDPANVTWEYTLSEAADDLISRFGAGEFDRVTVSEAPPEIQRGYPMRFELIREKS